MMFLTNLFKKLFSWILPKFLIAPAKKEKDNNNNNNKNSVFEDPLIETEPNNNNSVSQREVEPLDVPLGEEDSEVDNFLDSVLSGKTEELRKEYAKQQLEKLTTAKANTNTSHNNNRNDENNNNNNNNENVASAGSPTTANEGDTDDNNNNNNNNQFLSSAARSLRNYELVAYLGKGTFAEVTLARHTPTDELYAIKKISKQKVKEEGCVERTFTERQLLASMKHPFLIELHQAFQSRTHLYLVLDFAQGGDLYYFDNKKLWLKRLKRVLTKFEYPYYVKRGAAFIHSSAHSHSESLADTNLLMGESTASRKGVGHRKGNPKIHGSTDNVSTTRRRVRKKSVSLHGEKKKLSMEQEHDSPLAGGESHLMPLAERKSSTMGNFGDDENENSNTHFNKEYETMSEEDDFNSGNKSFFGETIPEIKNSFRLQLQKCLHMPSKANKRVLKQIAEEAQRRVLGDSMCDSAKEEVEIEHHDSHPAMVATTGGTSDSEDDNSSSDDGGLRNDKDLLYIKHVAQQLGLLGEGEEAYFLNNSTDEDGGKKLPSQNLYYTTDAKDESITTHRHSRPHVASKVRRVKEKEVQEATVSSDDDEAVKTNHQNNNKSQPEEETHPLDPSPASPSPRIHHHHHSNKNMPSTGHSHSSSMITNSFSVHPPTPHGSSFVTHNMQDSKVVFPEVAKDNSRLSIRLIAFFAAEIALVLTYLHGEGFIYRDLKPENILMTREGHLKLTDFGVAKHRKGAVINKETTNETTEENNNNNNNNNEKTASFTGTTQYMSPEMLKGLPHDSRTDWWSFGCLLFEWANGRKAFDDKNQFRLFTKIVEEPLEVTPEDFHITALEVHTRVAQLHYRHEELRREIKLHRDLQTTFNQSFHKNEKLQEGMSPTRPNTGNNSFDNASLKNFIDANGSFNASFTSLGNGSFIAFPMLNTDNNGTPANISFQIQPDGNIIANIGNASFANVIDTNNNNTTSNNNNSVNMNTNTISGKTLTPENRDVFLEDSLSQISEANALLHDLINALLDKDVNKRLAGADVLEHPFFTCPYICSQLYYKQEGVYQRFFDAHPTYFPNAKNKNAKPVLYNVKTDSETGNIVFVEQNSNNNKNSNNIHNNSSLAYSDRTQSTMLEEGTTHPYNTEDDSINNNNNENNENSNTNKSVFMDDITASQFIHSLPRSKRPTEWRELFLHARIDPLYVPQLRSKDDLKYFPAAVTANGLSAAVEQHKKIKEKREIKKEQLRQVAWAAAAQLNQMTNSMNPNSISVGTALNDTSNSDLLISRRSTDLELPKKIENESILKTSDNSTTRRYSEGDVERRLKELIVETIPDPNNNNNNNEMVQLPPVIAVENNNNKEEDKVEKGDSAESFASGSSSHLTTDRTENENSNTNNNMTNNEDDTNSTSTQGMNKKKGTSRKEDYVLKSTFASPEFLAAAVGNNNNKSEDPPTLRSTSTIAYNNNNNSITKMTSDHSEEENTTTNVNAAYYESDAHEEGGNDEGEIENEMIQNFSNLKEKEASTGPLHVLSPTGMSPNNNMNQSFPNGSSDSNHNNNSMTSKPASNVSFNSNTNNNNSNNNHNLVPIVMPITVPVSAGGMYPSDGSGDHNNNNNNNNETITIPVVVLRPQASIELHNNHNNNNNNNNNGLNYSKASSVYSHGSDQPSHHNHDDAFSESGYNEDDDEESVHHTQYDSSHHRSSHHHPLPDSSQQSFSSSYEYDDDHLESTFMSSQQDMDLNSDHSSSSSSVSETENTIFINNSFSYTPTFLRNSSKTREGSTVDHPDGATTPEKVLFTPSTGISNYYPSEARTPVAGGNHFNNNNKESPFPTVHFANNNNHNNNDFFSQDYKTLSGIAYTVEDNPSFGKKSNTNLRKQVLKKKKPTEDNNNNSDKERNPLPLDVSSRNNRSNNNNSDLRYSFNTNDDNRVSGNNFSDSGNSNQLTSPIPGEAANFDFHNLENINLDYFQNFSFNSMPTTVLAEINALRQNNNNNNNNNSNNYRSTSSGEEREKSN